ncbi:MAG: hypothetical protein IPN69_03830 [Acidobacteria bacterium]|nr:hypothetical protein [Acidobacteriota bacterium]MBK8149719.1 hypothetical protein [Acidobacteriota bacterium]MBK8809844.1 hypothetical protein [Acidobacteriota bacterium]
MIRAIALSLVLLLGVGVVIPLTTDFAEAGPKKHRKYAKKKKKIKKYSKKWWRLYHARMKRKKALLARKRALRLRQIRLAKMRRNSNAPKAVTKTSAPVAKTTKTDDSPAILPNGDVAPKTWKKNQSSQSELQFRVDDENGSQLGSAAISVVGPSTGDDNNARVKSVGGVPTTSLRRNVIDQMIRENGWVVNDFQKEVGGKKVYVVVAQAEGKGGAVQSRIFYFAEVEGRIYSVSTNSPTDSTERIAEESEKVINMLVRRRQNPQQAGLK